MIINEKDSTKERLIKYLSGDHHVEVVPDAQDALYHATESNHDLAIISLSMENFDGLRLWSQFRSLARTRMLPLLLVADTDEEAKLILGIDLGVNDYVNTPVDAAELNARVRTQIKRKRLNDRLRESIQKAMESAIRDPLTGLSNGRYFDRHVKTLFDTALVSGKPLSLITPCLEPTPDTVPVAVLGQQVSPWDGCPTGWLSAASIKLHPKTNEYCYPGNPGRPLNRTNVT